MATNAALDASSGRYLEIFSSTLSTMVTFRAASPRTKVRLPSVVVATSCSPGPNRAIGPRDQWDPSGTNVYIDSGPYGRYTVSSIDAASGSVQGSFTVQSPHITLSRDGSMLYAAEPNGIVSLKTPLLTKAGFFSQPGVATGFTLAADRPIGAAVNSSTATLCYIDPQSGKVNRALPIAIWP